MVLRLDVAACALDAELDLPGIGAELLAERQRRRVLEVGPADLDDIGEGFRLGLERRAEAAQRRQQPLLDLERRGGFGTSPKVDTSFELGLELFIDGIGAR